mmetsp:Transcript_146/g.352  ORF Transcript_146/g.352 Transcript_146/m.352 type:complete len:218 (-) Transcript_146:585-1238(-)
MLRAAPSPCAVGTARLERSLPQVQIIIVPQGPVRPRGSRPIQRRAPRIRETPSQTAEARVSRLFLHPRLRAFRAQENRRRDDGISRKVDEHARQGIGPAPRRRVLARARPRLHRAEAEGIHVRGHGGVLPPVEANELPTAAEPVRVQEDHPGRRCGGVLSRAVLEGQAAAFDEDAEAEGEGYGTQAAHGRHVRAELLRHAIVVRDRGARRRTRQYRG